MGLLIFEKTKYFSASREEVADTLIATGVAETMRYIRLGLVLQSEYENHKKTTALQYNKNNN